MREIARVQQGFFPTQERIVRAAARLFKLPAQQIGPVVVLDAGCGTGKAIHDLREAWLAQRPDLNVALLGIESDKGRYAQAVLLLAGGKGGGTALWFFARASSLWKDADALRGNNTRILPLVCRSRLS